VIAAPVLESVAIRCQTKNCGTILAYRQPDGSIVGAVRVHSTRRHRRYGAPAWIECDRCRQVWRETGRAS
jgi:hypothetical protein